MYKVASPQSFSSLEEINSGKLNVLTVGVARSFGSMSSPKKGKRA